ncbi:3-isopropylmalate dehydratase small subunit 1 [archaeon HR06]|nr:3-isopropylmalate dehydratase small subunit 1 [archaeon HR06]
MLENGWIKMEPFKKVTSIIVPLDRANIDTDQIIPKQFLKLVQRKGFGDYLFYDWRYDEKGKPKEDFILNNPLYRGAKILLTRGNFGCGSSREHAVWALMDFGFKVILAPSFADIFYNNCIKNGLLPAIMKEEDVDEIFNYLKEKPKTLATVDLEEQKVILDKRSYFFKIDEYRKKLLLEGLDEIAITLRYEEKIKEYERRMKDFLIPKECLPGV